MHTEGFELEDIENGTFKGGGFALYRLSGMSDFTYIAQRGVVESSNTAEQNTPKGLWAASPFTETEQCPLLTLQPDVCEIHAVPEFSNYKSIYAKETGAESERENYKQGFIYCHNLLQEKRMKKVVLSRRLSLELQGQCNPLRMFYELCIENPRSYVCLWWTPASGYWFTASPETLIAKESDTDNAWKTMALAGTMPWNGELLPPEEWSNKNRKEQACVASYIKEQLKDIASLEEEETSCHTVRAAGVMHLCTDISFRFKEGTSLSTILRALHPTPAVCGEPKEASMAAILNSEKTPRKYYAGYSGPIGINGVTGLYVSLRCMHLDGNEATLYAGGGLMPESILEEEWEETQRKLQPMLRLFETERATKN